MTLFTSLFYSLNNKIKIIYLKSLSNEKNTYEKARIITLLRGLIFSFGYYFIYLLCTFFETGESLKFRILPFFLLSILGIYWCVRGKWKLCAHMLIVSSTLLNMCSIFFNTIAIDILFIQNVTLCMLISNIILGIQWGSIYTLINIFISCVFFSTNTSSAQITTNIDTPILVTLIYSFVFITLYIWSFLEVIKKILVRNEIEIIKRKQLFDELQVTANTAKKLANSKTEFLSNMSHELRTPLNSVIGFSNLLLIEDPTESQKQNLNLLLFSAENLLALINNILDFNKLDVGKIELEKFDFNLSTLIDKLYLDSNVKTKKKNIGFVVQYDPALKDLLISGDITRLTQILYNLLENAIKFTNEGHVMMEVLVRNKNHTTVDIHFEIKDTGIGIHPEALSRIFKPFEQAEANTTRKFGGTGLGLSIVKKLVELHHSVLECNSTLGLGTSFQFTIKYPLSTLDTKLEKIILPTNDLAFLKQLKVLLVEDNPMNILLMSKLFERWHIQYSIANDGKASVELALANEFDLIFMDINMPIMDGIEASTIIKNHKPNICIVALTANTTNYEEHTTYKNIFNHYISKPIIHDKLLKLLMSKGLKKNKENI